MPPTVTGDRLWPEGTLRVPRDTCPGCAGQSHTGRTRDGATTDQVIAFLAGLPETVHVPYEPRDDRR